MLHDYIESHTVSIVFIGDFNPTIIQPFWLANKGLIRESEAQKAKIDVIHNDLVQFEIDWLFLVIQKNRFELRTNKAPYFEPLKDLAISIFKILKETPLIAVGINHIKDFALPSAKEYYNFGNKLVPLSIWSDFLKEPKLQNLVILDVGKNNETKNITISPSPKDLGLQFGVRININNHFPITVATKNRDGEVLEILSSQWNGCIKDAEVVTEKIWSKVSQ